MKQNTPQQRTPKMTDATTLNEAITNLRTYSNTLHMVARSEEPRLARREALMIAALNEVVRLGKTSLSNPMFNYVDNFEGYTNGVAEAVRGWKFEVTP
jgi:hypothetical protein